MTTLEEIARALYRLLNPRTRVVSTFKHVVNTGTRRKRGCILCGATCPGWSGKYARTKQSHDWERNHNCAATWLASHGVQGTRLEQAVALAESDSEEVLADLLMEHVRS